MKAVKQDSSRKNQKNWLLNTQPARKRIEGRCFKEPLIENEVWMVQHWHQLRAEYEADNTKMQENKKQLKVK